MAPIPFPNVEITGVAQATGGSENVFASPGWAYNGIYTFNAAQDTINVPYASAGNYYGGAQAVIAKNSGLWYCELQIAAGGWLHSYYTPPNPNYSGNGLYCGFAIGPTSGLGSDPYAGTVGLAFCGNGMYVGDGGSSVFTTVNIGVSPLWGSTGDIAMVACDATNKKVWFGKNGVWNTNFVDTISGLTFGGLPDPTGSGIGGMTLVESGPYSPYCAVNQQLITGGTCSMRLKSKPADLAFTPPVGFSPWI